MTLILCGGGGAGNPAKLTALLIDPDSTERSWVQSPNRSLIYLWIINIINKMNKCTTKQ